MSTLGPGRGSRWEGRQAVRASGKDYEWRGLLRCERCSGWTLHTGVRLGVRLPWFSFLVSFLGWAMSRALGCHVTCERCGIRRRVTDAQDEQLRLEGQRVLHGYLEHARGVDIDTKSLADEEVVRRVAAERTRGPMTVQEAERELRRRER